MPSQQELKWSQLRVGLVVIAALAALSVLIFLMSGSTGGLFTRKVNLRAYFDNANGLTAGAPVTLDGVTIGSVNSVRILAHHEPDAVEVNLRVGAQFLPSLHIDSTAAIVQAGVLGDAFLDISSATANGPMPTDGTTLRVARAPGIPEVIRTSQQTLTTTNSVITKLGTAMDTINGGKGTASMLMNDPEVARNITRMIAQLEILTEQLSSGKGTLGKLITDDQLYDRANSTIDKLDNIATRLQNGQGTAGKLIQDDALYQNLNTAVINTNTLLSGINSGNGSLGKLAHDPAFAQKVEESVTRLNDLLKGLDEGKGSLGQLVVNRSLYDHADQTLQQSGGLVAAMRNDPKKYLTVHVKLF